VVQRSFFWVCNQHGVLKKFNPASNAAIRVFETGKRRQQRKAELFQNGMPANFCGFTALIFQTVNPRAALRLHTACRPL
jgi:hypothetical protein